MTHLLWYLCGLIFPCTLQAADTLRLSREECEAVFLEKNLILMAEKLSVSRAEAMEVQAGLRPNPEISVEDVNLWTTRSGTNNPSYFGDELPPIAGNFGKNLQMSIALEQLIETAGKRKLRISLAELDTELTREYFEEILRGIRSEFRQQLNEILYLQEETAYYETHLRSLESLAEVMKAQADRQLIPREDLARLRISIYELKKDMEEINTERRELQKNLKILMHLPADNHLVLAGEPYHPENVPVEIPALDFLIGLARENRADLRQARRQEEILHTRYRYEKSMKVPDLRLKAGYERGGFFHNFIGVGVGIDLPFFDRNQGNIQYAKTGIVQAEIMTRQLESVIENEVAQARDNLVSAIGFIADSSADPGPELDLLYEKYTEQLKSRNISLLRYIDFTEAWLGHKIDGLKAAQRVENNAEQLNFIIGTDLIK